MIFDFLSILFHNKKAIMLQEDTFAWKNDTHTHTHIYIYIYI